MCRRAGSGRGSGARCRVRRRERRHTGRPGGADVVAGDLCPQLLERGRERARVAGVTLQWREANAEALPFDGAAFDAVISGIGVMFAPHHQTAADELVRVCRLGGTIVLISWTPEGFVGRRFAAMQPFVPPPPAGVQPAPLCGSPDHVRDLRGERVTDLVMQRHPLRVDHFADGAAFRDFFKAHDGPAVAAYRGIEHEPDRVAALDAELAGLGDRYLVGSSGMDWEYLLVAARKASTGDRELAWPVIRDAARLSTGAYP